MPPTGPTNAVFGDQDEPTTLPQSVVPEAVLVEEKKMAKYSKTAEFKRLRDFMEARIKFFQKYLPGGQPVKEVPENERAAYWQAACVIIDEFQNVLNEYDQAAGVVNAANK